MRAHPDYEEKYANNPDEQNRNLAFRRIFEDVMGKQRKVELDFYRMVSKDEAFKTAMLDTVKRVLGG